MKKTYNTGIDTNQISLDVTVGTPGVVHTTAYQKRAGKKIIFAESSEDNGNIPLTKLGTALAIKNNELIVQSLIDFSALPDEQWETLADNLSIKYHLSGGASGNQFYENEDDDLTSSQSGKIVVVIKHIELL